ncbi:hypothetical protein [Terrihabitans sp. B22-R8]|uniref:hypothetical protein n=1 Tax=Terrihabitans sp. B22-R8 TaxID=3425128 RepID=UPI00403C9C9F
MTPASGSERQIQSILHPDSRDAALWRPGACVVVRVDAPAQLAVSVSPSVPNGSVAASVEIEALTQGTPPAPQRVAPPVAQAINFADDAGPRGNARIASGISLLAHVAGRGDVIVGSDEWAGGPSAPSRIEGIAIDWPNRPPGLDLRYAAHYGQRNVTNSGLQGLGSFVGSRGRAMPIVGLTLELVGASSGQKLVAEALFLGSPTQRSAGSRIQLAGPSRHEPLVGLRLSIEAAAEQPAQAPAYRTPTPVSLPKPTRGAASPKVRVFRGKANANSA